MIEELQENVRDEGLRDELILLITIYVSYVIEESEDMKVLSNGKVGLLPDFANLFVLYDLGKRCQRMKLGNSWIGRTKQVVQVLSTIFRWLNFKKFTHTLANINEDFT